MGILRINMNSSLLHQSRYFQTKKSIINILIPFSINMSQHQLEPCYINIKKKSQSLDHNSSKAQLKIRYFFCISSNSMKKVVDQIIKVKYRCDRHLFFFMYFCFVFYPLDWIMTLLWLVSGLNLGWLHNLNFYEVYEPTLSVCGLKLL